MKTFRFMMAILAMACILTGCEPTKDKDQQSTSGATQAAPAKIVKNAAGRTIEQENIYSRIKVTTDPTKVMWIHLIALDGKIVRRMPISGKVTSSGKRLEPRHFTPNMDRAIGKPPPAGDYYTDELIQPDGTYGDSDPYIYWFDPMGRYHQWGTAGGLGYLLTDYPIDLENPQDRITGMYNAEKAAAEWQAQQEAKLRQQEGKGR